MSRTPSDGLVRIRRGGDVDRESIDSPEAYTCPVEGCNRTVLGKPGHLRNHVRQSTDDAHRGLTLTPSLELQERYKIESDLREQYVEKQKTQQEIADEWGVGRNTVYRWLKRHGIERREWTGTGSANRVEQASFYTERSGYERVGAYDPTEERMVWTKVHQLVAIADGAEPAEVFSEGEYQCHHRTGVPWDNRAENIELLDGRNHQRAHRRDEWTTEDGFPVLLTGDKTDNGSTSAAWGPGAPESMPERKEAVSDSEDSWGPGAPLTEP